MLWEMSFLWLLAVLAMLVLALGVAALIRYLFFRGGK